MKRIRLQDVTGAERGPGVEIDSGGRVHPEGFKEYRVGVISDTHGLFDRAILRHFQGLDHIVHAGDIGDSMVIEQLRGLAPVTAVSGNVDGYESSGFPMEAELVLGGRRIAIRHIVFEGGRMTRAGRCYLERDRPDVCVFGHTHRATSRWWNGTLLFNPGSAGRKRFALPRGLGLLTINDEAVTPALIQLDDRPES